MSPAPTIGRTVLYQTDGRGGYHYSLPAVVVRTRASTDTKAVADGKVAALPDAMTVDLLVMSCDGETYGENGVPYGEATDHGIRENGDTYEGGPQRSWRWPPRV